LQEHLVYRSPDVREQYTTNGFSVTHYMANPAFLHLNSGLTFQDATNGTAHAWLAGEVAGGYQPWGYPFNWRELTAPLNAAPSSFGRPTGDGAHFVMADASVQFLLNDVDTVLLETLTSNPPLPAPALTQRPNRLFEVVKRNATHYWKTHELEDSNGVIGLRAFVSPGRVEFVEHYWRGKGFERGFEIRDVVVAITLYPEAERLWLETLLDDKVATAIGGMKSLSWLRVNDVNLSARGLQSIAKLPNLRHLRIERRHGSDVDEGQLQRLREARPSTDIVVRRW
jgi:hypothetical protein